MFIYNSIQIVVRNCTYIFIRCEESKNRIIMGMQFMLISVMIIDKVNLLILCES